MTMVRPNACSGIGKMLGSGDDLCVGPQDGNYYDGGDLVLALGSRGCCLTTITAGDFLFSQVIVLASESADTNVTGLLVTNNQ